MKILSLPAEMAAWSQAAVAAGRRIVLVPTMGYFHEGHLSLMDRGRAQGDALVVSLFVNPIQFGPGEDLGRYPRDFQRDSELAAGRGAEVLFAPGAGDMYPADSASRVVVSGLDQGLCGAKRPGHFAGVTTVVAKLFHLVRPHVAVFGEKDFQQLAIIRRMVADLDFQVEVIGHPIVREADGLAMSSRNVYLSADERRRALCLHQALTAARQACAGGLRDGAAVARLAEECIRPHARIDYIEIADRRLLRPQERIDADSMLFLAAFVGTTRLIDNCRLLAGGDA
ncbi:MAG: pantoate--beta-alanine ligase [Thermodesulfobacteriota bacterium]